MTAGYLSHRPHYQLQTHCGRVSLCHTNVRDIGFSLQTLRPFVPHVQSSSLCIQINKIRIHPWENSSSSNGKSTSNEFLLLMNIIYFCVIPTDAITIVVCVFSCAQRFAVRVCWFYLMGSIVFALRHWNSIIDAANSWYKLYTQQYIIICLTLM